MYSFLCMCVCAAVLVTEAKQPDPRGGRLKSSSHTEGTSEYDVRFHPGRSSQCLVNGITLFEGAAWSPEPCKVCQCRSGVASCNNTPCPQLVAPRVPQVKVNMKNASRPHAVRSRRLNMKTDTETRPRKTAQVNSFAAKKQMSTQKRKKEDFAAAVRPVLSPDIQSSHVLLEKKFVPKTNKNILLSTGHFDHDDDDDYDSDDDDDEDSSVQKANTANRRPTVPLTTKPLPIPNSRAEAPPTGRQSVRPKLQPSVPNAKSYMESLPAGCLLSYSLIACGSTGMTHFPIIRDPGIRAIYLADNKITKISARALAGLPNLEWLDLSKNKLDDSSLGPDVFRNLTKLRRLILDGNNLTKVPALPSSLVELKINDNSLSGLTPNTFKGLSKLLTLELEDNHFHDGNVSPLTFAPLRKLIYLRLDDNNFRAVPSGLPTSLQELRLSDNRIEVVHTGVLNKTVNLRVLDVSHNRIREDRIAPRAWIHLLKLEMLDLSHNKLVHVPSFLPAGLRQLVLHHNHIERIPGYVFGHMRPGLDSLDLSHNKLREDGIDEVSFIGLQHSLSELLLNHNQLTSVPRGLLQLKALHVLRLNSNFISYIPLNGICDMRAAEDSPLTAVHLQNNLIDRRLIPPTAFSCIKTYQSVLLRPQRYEDYD
ncbi:extracellular matrix protein 2 [Denticeps clupeoides]|uniref:VWFC domain-containing protein n=1 Tax=Denticeps clupeoides TaxID=299321 RepID=A0AAY4DVR5_9TELE|nr:extracellular matrix protein 2-like [Denticeps clupeoides]